MANRTQNRSYPRRSRGRSGSTSIMVSAVLAAMAAAWYYWGDDIGFPMPTGGSSSGSVVAEAPADPAAPETTAANPPPAAKGEAILGTASVVDADTLDIHSQRIRLVGVDAPESKQKCLDPSGVLYRCGAAAANALDKWINANPVTCISEGHDRYNRTLGKCTVRGTSVQNWLVSNGHAVAYRAYSKEFVSAEDTARTAQAGIWAGEFVMPWDWRKGVRLAAEDAKS